MKARQAWSVKERFEHPVTHAVLVQTIDDRTPRWLDFVEACAADTAVPTRPFDEYLLFGAVATAE